MKLEKKQERSKRKCKSKIKGKSRTKPHLMHDSNLKLRNDIDLIQSTYESELAFEGENINIQGTYSERINSSPPYRYSDRNIEKKLHGIKCFYYGHHV